MAEEYRTIMYSVGVKGEVLVHKFPWNANKREGMQKLQKLVRRGFTFDDPRKKGLGIPEVIVTRVMNINKSELGEGAEAEVGVSVELILCPECGKGCKTRWGLEVHQRVHRKK